MMAAKRARQLANGVEAQIDNAENDDKPTVLALREIAARRIDQDYIAAVDKAARERREREATAWAAAEVVAEEDMSKGDDRKEPGIGNREWGMLGRMSPCPVLPPGLRRPPDRAPVPVSGAWGMDDT